MGRILAEAREIGIRPDYPDIFFPGMEFVHNAPTSEKGFSTWHQDHGTFGVMHQSVQHFLNLYVVVNKTDPTDGGLAVVPFDVLKMRTPKLHDIVVGSSMRSFNPLNLSSDGKGFWFDDGATDVIRLGAFDMTEVTCYPPTTSGDIVVIRGDTIHGTQTALRSDRISAALRFGVREMHIAPMLRGLIQLEYMNTMLNAFYTRMDYATFSDTELMQISNPNACPWSLWLRTRSLEWHIHIRFNAMLLGKHMLLLIRHALAMLQGGEDLAHIEVLVNLIHGWRFAAKDR